jgi:hypothetical protein
MRRTGLLLWSIFLFFYTHAQKEGNIWYFGLNAGLDFSSGDPVALKNGQVYQSEGVASICDKEGQLLFYTDGMIIYNRNHGTMTNGQGLLGHNSSTQSAIIVPAISDSYRFYVFTVDAEAGSNGVCYSIVNMGLDGGLGDVEVKNVQLLTPACEKLTAIKHCNGKDTWVITHGWNSNAFYAFLLTSTGIQAPVISRAGRSIDSDNGRTAGYMKAAPDGSKLALANYRIGVDLFDFDPATGRVSNPVELLASEEPYGIEFSPNSALLYVTDAKALSATKYTIPYYNLMSA